MDADCLSGLVLAHLVGALRLVEDALDLVDIPREISVSQLQNLSAEARALQVSAAALAQQGGASWEAMAHQLDVTRQSLHRRLSSRSLEYLEEAVDTSELRMEWLRLINRSRAKLEALAETDPQQFSRRMADALNGERGGIFFYRLSAGHLSYPLNPEEIRRI